MLETTDSNSSKNFVLARETTHLRNAIIIPLTESHRYLQSLGGEYIAKANDVISMAAMLDSIAGDDRATDFISQNSNLTFSDKECTSLNKIFPHGFLDVSEIEGVFYNVIETVENLLSFLDGLFQSGRENVKKVIVVLSDLVGKLKRTMNDTALKFYMHTKIEMIIRSQSALRVA